MASIIIKRKTNTIPLTWISNPIIRMRFPIEQDIFEINDIGYMAYLDPYFEIIDMPGADRVDKSVNAPCWSKYHV